MKQNWSLTFSDETCVHTPTCGCLLTLRGVSETTEGMEWTGISGSLEEQYLDAACYIESKTSTYADRFPTAEEQRWFAARLKLNSTIRLIEPPIPLNPNWPQSSQLFAPHPEVIAAMKRADFRYFNKKFPSLHFQWEECEKYIWSNTPVHNIPDTINRRIPFVCREVPALSFLACRALSSYHWCFGYTNGRPHAIAAAEDLYPHKYASAILNIARNHLSDNPKEPLKYLNQALDHLYRLLDVDLEKKSTLCTIFKRTSRYVFRCFSWFELCSIRKERRKRGSF